MSIVGSFQISASGMEVQQRRLDIAAENVANLNTTKTPEGGPYQRKIPEISTFIIQGTADGGKFGQEGAVGARVTGVVNSPEPPLRIYDPEHPDADGQGFVSFPQINSAREMVDASTASTAYEANVSVFNAAKTMILRTLDIGGV